MITRSVSIVAVCVLFVGSVALSPAATDDSLPLKDPKGNCLIVAYDATELPGNGMADLVGTLTTELATTAPECRLVVLDKMTRAGIDKALDGQKDDDLGAVVKIQPSSDDDAAIRAGVYHYAFDPVDGPHVPSPEYSFKFASDSALLAICLSRAVTNVEVEPAKGTKSGLTLPVLKKTLQLSIPKSVVADTDKAKSLGCAVAAAFKAFRENDSYSVMGVVTDKARRHTELKNIEVQLHKFVYADREFTKEEEVARKTTMDAVVQTAKPSSSGLYWFSGLDYLSPYTISFVDTSKAEGAFRREPDSAQCVSSSMRGIVRTVPCVLAAYKPLPKAAAVAAVAAPKTEEFDCLIRQATVFTGEKNARPFTADVGIAGDRIAAVGKLSGRPSKKTIEGKGLYLMPGFIDIHSHADSTVMRTPHAPSHVRQGITTVLAGNCASSTGSIGQFLATLNKKGTPVNLGMLIGNTPVRRMALGKRKGMFPYSDLYREKELVDLAMEEGAFGMSTGLIYTTSEEAFAWELVELSRQLQPYGGFYASHLRGETDEVLDSVREAIYIGELAQVPVQVSHMKVLKKHNWGKMDDYIKIIKSARARGIDVTGDQYPWEASGPAGHNSLYDLIVREAINLDQPDVVILKDMPGKYEKYSGKTLAELLEAEKMTPEELIKDLDLKRDSKLYAAYRCIGDEDICRAIKEDFIMVCTDASIVTPRDMERELSDKHPRSFRTYPRLFSHYVRDRGIIGWPLAVYKCTGLPAKRMKLDDRGVIRPGAFADIVVLDPKALDPVVMFRDQTPPPKGIEYVFINGQLALDKGEMTNITAGRPLYAYGNGKP